MEPKNLCHSPGTKRFASILGKYDTYRYCEPAVSPTEEFQFVHLIAHTYTIDHVRAWIPNKIFNPRRFSIKMKYCIHDSTRFKAKISSEFPSTETLETVFVKSESKTCRIQDILEHPNIYFRDPRTRLPRTDIVCPILSESDVSNRRLVRNKHYSFAISVPSYT